MPQTILICDDSNLARKQLVRSLPESIDALILQAADGQEAMEILTTQEVHLLFLDLNMPVMDGYEVLSTMQINRLSVPTLVVSGDVQQQARNRVKQLGAMEFIQKPIKPSQLEKLVTVMGFAVLDTQAAPEDAIPATEAKQKVLEGFDINFRDCYQELSNVSMGRAAEKLSEVLGVFITLPVPNVNMLEMGELQMALGLADEQQATAICQGFMAKGVSGEAILLINDVSMENLAELMSYEENLTEHIERELVMDIGNILIGTFLKSFGELVHLHFSQGHPNLMGEHLSINRLLHMDNVTTDNILAIEINYGIENTSISCHQLMLFTKSSLQTLNDRVQYLTN